MSHIDRMLSRRKGKAGQGAGIGEDEPTLVTPPPLFEGVHGAIAASPSSAPPQGGALLPQDFSPASGLLATSEKGFFRTYLEVKGALDRYYINRTPMLTCGEKQFAINDLVTIAVLSNTNMYLMGSRGSGKTLLSEVVRRSVFNDSGLYLRGDPNLNIKDLFMRLNLHGKTDEEIYRIAESVGFTFALIDELNRVPGVLQNQFLNLIDGYIEIRGQKYPLGRLGYMLAMATGNPPTNGEYTGVFDEDLALLDRIPLIINVDEVEHARGDISRIMRTDTEKSRILQGDLAGQVLAAHGYLEGKLRADSGVAAVVSLFSEFVYDSFRYVTLGNRRVDKAQEDDWRDSLLGEHQGGRTISYVSDVSVRTLKNATKLSFAIYEAARVESELLKARGISEVEVGCDDFLDAYINSLKLALTYDRRFIPADLPRRLGRTHADMLDSVFSDLVGSFEPDEFEDACMTLEQFYEAVAAGDSRLASNIMKAVSDSMEEKPMLKLVHGVMDSEMMQSNEAGKNALLRQLAEE